MRSCFKKSLSVFVLLTFLMGASFADAAGSSFSGGGRSSSGFSSSKPSTSFSTPKPSMSTPSPSVSKPSGNAYAGPAAPTMSKPPAAFSNSSGSTAGAPQQKTGSAFGGANPATQQPAVQPKPSTSGSYSAPAPRYNAREYTTYNPNTRTIIIREQPSGWTPRYYGGTVVVNNNPSYLALWWQMEMLESIHDRNERDALMRQMQANPEYGNWRNEANKLAGENAALKAQLNHVDHPDQAVTVSAAETGSPAKKSGSHWFLWILLICAIGGGAYLLFRRK